MKRTSKFLVAASAVAVIVAGSSLTPVLFTPAAPFVTATAMSEPASPSGASPTLVGAAPMVGTTKITSQPGDAEISRYGTRTSATFAVKASGSKLKYTWQQRSSASAAWKTISGATSAKYTAKSSAWANGTQFRAVVTGTSGTAKSRAATLTVLFPTKTPAQDAEKAFGLAGLRQGLDLSAYQYTPNAKVKMAAVDAWAGSDGFTILRNGSGARPIKQKYTSVCTDKSASTGSTPVTEDCAYRILADAAKARGLSLGHYWFNGWISSIDTTKKDLFAGNYTPTASAKQFVKWLIADGNYKKSSTDPLVLDVEAGRAWTKSDGSKKYTLTLRAWNPSETMEFLSVVKKLLTDDGYSANLYVYMSANAADKQSGGAYVWSGVAGMARLWVASWGTDNARIPASQPKVGPWMYYGGWSIWQYTSNARISGSGVEAVDADVAKSDAWTPR
jgi:glycosyl hydrolase family 25